MGYKIPEACFFEIGTKFDLRLPRKYYLRAMTAPGEVIEERLGKIVRLPFRGNIAAGLGGDGEALEHHEYIEVLENYLDGSDPANCFTLRVTGDSMRCDDVEKDIPEGVTIIIDQSIQPLPNDIVVCEFEYEGERIGVLKIYRPEKDHVILKSYNEKHKPIILDEGNPATLRGVYINHIPLGRRSRRRRIYQFS